MQVFVEGLTESGLEDNALAGFKSALGLVLVNPEGIMALYVAWLNGHPSLGDPEAMARFRQIGVRQAGELVAMWQDANQMMGGLGRGQGPVGGQGGGPILGGGGLIRP